MTHGTIRDPSGRLLPLAARTDVGRSANRYLRLDSQHASQRHAEVRHAGGRWVVIDTQSRNGTRVNGRRIEAGVPWALREDDRLTFGDSEAGAWVLVSAKPPALLAQRVRDGLVVVEEEGSLALPPAVDEPELLVYRDPEGGFWKERDGRATRAKNEEFIELTDAWCLHLPPEVTETLPMPPSLTLGRVTLHLRVDRTGEHVEAWLEQAEGLVDLGSGTHWMVAYVLANNRLADTVPEIERGWMDVSVIARETGIRERCLDAYYSRIRQALRRAGLEDAQRAVEARPNRRRLGTERVVVHRPS